MSVFLRTIRAVRKSGIGLSLEPRFAALLTLALCALVAFGCNNSTATGSASAKAWSDADRQSWAKNATWAPGQLLEHFSKHGAEGPYSSVDDYDRAARATVISGTSFMYVDRESKAPRMGFYDIPSNGFTSLTTDGQRILTFFHPDRRESYVRGLDRSTFR